MTELAGVYRITNTLTGHVYIGGSVMMKRRLRTHRQVLRRGDHYARRLQADWDRQGAEAFRFEQLLICRPEDVILFEQRAIDAHGASDPARGYNALPKAGRWAGGHHREESKRKIAIGRRGWHHTPETRARLAEAHKGMKASVEARAKMSAHWQGRVFSEEHRAKIAAAKRGHEVSAESRVKIGAASRGRRHTEAAKAAMSLARKGRPKSPETRARMAVAQQARAAARQKG